MKISTQTRYAVRMLVELALREDEPGRVSAKRIAANQGISEKYLESLAAKLRKNGVINSMKGVGGGFRLNRPANEIYLGEIMHMMETTFFETHCSKDAEKTCPTFGNCPICDVWEKVEYQISEIVNDVSIRDICNDLSKRREFETQDENTALA